MIIERSENYIRKEIALKLTGLNLPFTIFTIQIYLCNSLELKERDLQSNLDLFVFKYCLFSMSSDFYRTI